MARDKEIIKSTKKINQKPLKNIKKPSNQKSTKSSDSDSSVESDNSDSSETEELDVIEYRKFLGKLFPSKNLNKNIKLGNSVKKHADKSKLSNKKNKTTNNKCNEQMSDSDSDNYESCDSEEEPKSKKKQDKSSKNNINLILNVGESYSDDDSDYSYDSDATTETESENENDELTLSSSESDEEDKSKGKKVVKKELPVAEDVKHDFLLQLKDLQEKNKDNEIIQKCINLCETDITTQTKLTAKLNKKYSERNCRIFKKYIRDKNTLNDYAFFKKLDISKQKSVIGELREVNNVFKLDKPYSMTIIESTLPVFLKNEALKKINSLKHMDQGTGEYYKVKNWVDTFMRIPFGVYSDLLINIDDGIDKCHEFMETSQKILNDAVYGLNDAKMQIMQILGQLISNPKSTGTAIAIHGPPGSGKTSLVKEGISKILKRPFAFIALGGATDSSFLEGHSYTYEGSVCGKIIQILIESKCMNPVIYFDELDKISDTPKGEEIIGILTHLTDTSQNNQFHDKYFSEVSFDLSKCLFIFSYNDETKVNPILKDRMYRIQTKGYDKKQKMCISNNYLLPKIREQVNFKNDDIIITDEAINYIIDNNCDKEEGVRNLKRCLEIIHTKLNLYRLMKPDSNLFQEEMSISVQFPFTVTKQIVDKLIKKKDDNSFMINMYV
jgi:ATP-dependent Lon protease